MKVIGLTGGIASGKSTVAKAFVELGAKVIDADLIAREVVMPGQPAYEDIVREFGREVLDGDEINRKKLGALVFADEARRKRLNAITHPHIAATTQARLQALRDAGERAAIYEAALLVENGIHRGLDGLIVVALDEDQQIARACARDNMTVDEARARLAAQLPLADKIAVATWVIDNNGGHSKTRAQVVRVWNEINA